MMAATVATYRRDGIVLVDVPNEIRILQTTFLHDCCTWLEHFARSSVTPQTLPAVLAAIAQTDRRVIARLYKISRRFQAAKQLAAHPWFANMARTLMATKLVSCCHFVNVRVDLPGEEQYLLRAHQDFPYIQGSYNGITVWLPFHDTSLQVGPPAWVQGSHLFGVHPVREQRYGNGPVASGGRSFEIADPGIYASAVFTTAAVSFGSALVFSTKLLHRSEPNHSTIARLNIQLRFDDALAPESFERNYPDGLYLGDVFGTTYPEHVLSNEHA